MAIQKRFLVFFALVGVAVWLALSLPSNARAAAGTSPTPPSPRPEKVLPGGAFSQNVQEAPVGIAGGGPVDHFGYHIVYPTFAWIDATDGTDTGLSGGSSSNAVGPISLPFSFKFYEHTYQSLYIVAAGYLSFTESSYWPARLVDMPSPLLPNNLIAPFANNWRLWENGPEGRVYYKSGGTAPNRYFVVEWYKVMYNQTELSFEVVLHENGDIDFYYGDVMNGWPCGLAGIEDDLGWDGLAYLTFCSGYPGPGRAVRFDRPNPRARVKVFPPYQGMFAAAGQWSDFLFHVRNSGEVGTDVYDVEAGSGWPVSFWTTYIDPLEDTDGDHIPDTGPLAQEDTFTVLAGVVAPLGITIGDANTAEITVTSSLDTMEKQKIYLQQAVPAPFAVAFQATDDYHHLLYLIRPDDRQLITVTSADRSEMDTAVAQLSTGGFIYICHKFYLNAQSASVGEVEYVLLDHEGNPISSIASLISHAQANGMVVDEIPVLAANTRGQAGVGWTEVDDTKYHIFFAVVDGRTGDVTVGPVEITSMDRDAGRMETASLVPLQGGRFALAWTDTRTSHYQISYTVLNSDGSPAFPPVVVADGYNPRFAVVGKNKIFLAYSDYGDISFLLLDTQGNIIRPSTKVQGTPNGLADDVLPLANGNIVIGGENAGGGVYFVILDENYNVVKEVTPLSHPATVVSSVNLSLSADVWGHVIFWWQDWGAATPGLGYMYYALTDEKGNFVTQPMPFSEIPFAGARLGQAITTYLTFGDVPYTYWAAEWIERLYNAGVTSGCAPAQYCPGNPVTRAQMAKFILKGKHGGDYEPPHYTTYTFTDIEGSWAADWIEELYQEGIVSGYPDGSYRPNNVVTRAQMAKFILKGKHGGGYEPPHYASYSFTDIEGLWAADWIEELYQEGIVSGYSDGTYRPNNQVTRAQMAKFIVNAFDLP